MPLRPCLDCGKLSTGSRCAPHEAVHRRAKERGRRPRYDRAERTRRAVTVAMWVRTNGYVCPGWKRDPHPSRDLTADHVVPVGRGGSEAGPLTVLCRVCNGTKGASSDTQ